jgi:hypothetical protein
MGRVIWGTRVAIGRPISQNDDRFTGSMHANPKKA